MDRRPFSRLRAHYHVERELADRLRTAPRAERARLYQSVYEELYRRIPDHPQLTRRDTSTSRHEASLRQLAVLKPLLTSESVFLEIGSGDCGLSFEVASLVRHVYGVDVSSEITRRSTTPPNFTLILSDGAAIPLPTASVTIAYSHQLLEHLHPEDVQEHLREVHRVLVPGGRYLCMTPSRLSGPHDVSKYFTATATGLHLREYTTAELVALLQATGFHSARRWLRVKGLHASLPTGPFACLEALLDTLPRRPRGWLARSRPLEPLLRVEILGTKASGTEPRRQAAP